MGRDALRSRWPPLIGFKAPTRRRGRLPSRWLCFLCLLPAVLLGFLCLSWFDCWPGRMSAVNALLFEMRQQNPLLQQLDAAKALPSSGEPDPFPSYTAFPSLRKRAGSSAAVVGDRQRLELLSLPLAARAGPTDGSGSASPPQANHGAGSAREAPVCLLRSSFKEKEPVLSSSFLTIETELLPGTDLRFFRRYAGLKVQPRFQPNTPLPTTVTLPATGQTLRNGVLLFLSPHFPSAEALHLTAAEDLERSPAARFLHVTLPKLADSVLRRFPYPVHILHRGPMPTAVVSHITQTLAAASAVFVEDIEGVVDESLSPVASEVAKTWFETQKEETVAFLSRNEGEAVHAMAAAAEGGGTEGTTTGSAVPVERASNTPAPPLHQRTFMSQAPRPLADTDDVADAGNVSLAGFRWRRYRQHANPHAARHTGHGRAFAHSTSKSPAATDTTATTEAPTTVPPPTNAEILSFVEARIRKAKEEWEVRRFWAGFVWRLPSLSEYEYYWRLDADSVLSKPLATDVLAEVADRQCATAYHRIDYVTHRRVFDFWHAVQTWRQSIGLLVLEQVLAAPGGGGRVHSEYLEAEAATRGRGVNPIAGAFKGRGGGGEKAFVTEERTLPHPILFNQTAFHEVSNWLNNSRHTYTGKTYSEDFRIGSFAVLRHPLYASLFSFLDNHSPHGLLKYGWSEAVVHTVLTELITEQEGWNVCSFLAFAGYKHPR